MTIHEILKKYWNYDQFRPLQEDIIHSILANKDTLALLPTGGGKSICFQVPAMAMDGLCLVISPLIALMKDQVQNLRKRGIKASALYSGQTNSEIDAILSNCLYDPDMKFLYVSPERLKSEAFLKILAEINVSMIAVDEAHCISQWGYDFRPPYLEIAEIRPLFPNAAILALTATATPEVVVDIQKKLAFKEENLFQKSFKRDNLTYYVLKEECKQNRLLRIIEKNPGTGIIYVRNRRKTREIAEFLQKFNVSADFYHAGLTSEERTKKQEQWMNNTTRVVVSTNAFGMGIDKPDVRWVVHIDIPDTLEAYFQEAGRGGRDLKPSVAILLYDDRDIKTLKENVEKTFPPIETLRNSYKLIMQYYRIPIGEGEGFSAVFDPLALAKILKIDFIELYYHLSFFEKMGLFCVSGDLRKRSVLKMLCNGEPLLEHYKKYPENEPFIKEILRTFTGVFTDYAPIHESVLAQRLGIDVESVKKSLQQLDKRNVVSYIPKDEVDRILLLSRRVNEKFLYFTPEVYKLRKQVAEKRLASVIDFVENQKKCRSQILLAYFGEQKSEACGSCDICLENKKKEMTNREYQQIIQEVNKRKEMSQKEILEQLLPKFEEEKIIEVMRKLM